MASPETVPRKTRNETRRRGRRVLVVFVTLGLLGTFRLESDLLNIAREFTQAFVTPWGVVYLIDDPSPALTAHEDCHLQRLEEIGAGEFYLDYLFGGACAEEKRCGADPQTHPACYDERDE